MATRQLTRATNKAPPAGGKTPAPKAAKKSKAASSAAPAARRAQPRTAVSRATPALTARKTSTLTATRKVKAAASAAKPASMTGPLPAIVTLKQLAEWAGYNHDVSRKQAIEMFTGFVDDIGRVLKKGRKIRIPNLGILQVRVRPARPARTGRNPRTGEEIRIKASRASKKVAFRVAKALKEAI